MLVTTQYLNIVTNVEQDRLSSTAHQAPITTKTLGHGS
jgi:hypothetical protein